MTARAGMATLIGQLRAATGAGTADYSIAGSVYWGDDQLQAELDRVGQQWKDVQLYPLAVLTDGTASYYDYEFPPVLGRWFEEAGADSGFAVKDGVGGSIDVSSYAANYAARRISFTADQRGSVVLLDIRSYRLNAAAANVWRWKAANVANRVNWSSDNHRIDAGSEYQNCLDMAKYFSMQEGGAALTVSTLFRTDEA